VLQPQAVPLLTFFRAHAALAGVVSLVLVSAVADIVLLTERTRADVMLFVRDSVKMAQNAAPLDLRTSDTRQAEQWLKRELGFAPAAQNPSGFKLVGARSCHINNEPVGLLLFERDGQELSFYVSRSSLTALHGFDDTTPGGDQTWDLRRPPGRRMGCRKGLLSSRH
jgi:anti-sigma factor RsiW